jgi:hypothetical protein
MLRAPVIHIEGLDWTLDAFVDAHRLVRTDGEVPEIVRSTHAPAFRCTVVTAAGELRREVYAADVSWGDVLAVGPIAHAVDLDVCEACGALAGLDIFQGRAEDGELRTYVSTHCPQCYDNDGGGW